MTTTIFTSLLGPICETYYKYAYTQTLQQYDINTYSNYGFSTSFSLNFGFEIYEPLDLNNIQIQSGVFTVQSAFYLYPNIQQTYSTYFSIQNNQQWVLQDLPVSGIGTVQYVSKILPVTISLYQGISSVLGIASSFATNGIPYDSNLDIQDSIIRQFESSYVQNNSLSILILFNLNNVTFTGVSTNWSVLKTSLYTYEVLSYRINNGYGQYYSSLANNTFLNKTLNINTKELNFLYQSTYQDVYNWMNNLTWTPSFTVWFQANKTTLNVFILQFLSQFFGIS
jgi:hypothetical protein